MTYKVPFVLRGVVHEDCTVEYPGRRGGITFSAPDPASYLDELTLSTPSRMADLYELTLDDIVDYLVRLGDRLPLSKNPYTREAYDLACHTSGLSDSILEFQYEVMPHVIFAGDELRNIVRRSVGIEYLEGWVEQPPGMVPGLRARVRAFGARCVHVIAGNAPIVSYLTVARNALTRSDALVKTPSNDPLTAVAIARTMVDMEPDHPITKHLAVAYWKGGDEQVETAVYDPRRIEKIMAWGGFASIQHITQYLQPGLDLVTADPKQSGTIIGAEAFTDDATLRSVARRLTLDIGAANQEACVSARVVYVESGTDELGIERITRLGQLAFDELQQLPSHISTPHKAFDPDLKDEIDGARLMDEEYLVIGGKANEGAVIVSLSDEPVDFSRILACRVANLVPIDSIDVAIRSVNAYTQTIGVFPEALKERIADQLAYQGGQRLVSLGGAATMQHNFEIQDAIEPIRRLCKWVVQESCDDDVLAAATIQPGAG